MSAFKDTCLRTKAFRRLRAITLTVHIHVPLDMWTRDVGDLLSSAPLEALSIYYSTTTLIRTPIPDEFWKNMAARHGQRLKRFSVHRMQISLAALKVICSQCPLLEQLFIEAEQYELVSPFLTDCNHAPTCEIIVFLQDDAARLFALAKNLRTLHINFPLATSDSSVVSQPMLMERALSIASVCSPTLAHIGCNTRVWQVRVACVAPGSLLTQRLAKVKRTVHEDENGEKYVIPTLAAQENPDIPEQFLVMRA